MSSEGKRWKISGVQRHDSAGVLMSVFGPDVVGVVEVVPADVSKLSDAELHQLEEEVAAEIGRRG